MKRFGIALLWAVGGYLVGAFGGGWLVSHFSSNTHDRSVEAAMSGAFFWSHTRRRGVHRGDGVASIREKERQRLGNTMGTASPG